MNRYDRQLYKIMKKWRIFFYVKPKYSPYFLMRYRMKRCIGQGLCIQADRNEQTAIVCDGGGIYEYLKPLKDNIVFIDCSDNPEFWDTDIQGFEEFIKKKLKGNTKTVNSLIFALSYRSNLAALSLAYSMEWDYKIIDIYDLLDQKGIHTCYSDLCWKMKSDKESIKNLFRQIAQYYEMHSVIIRYLLYICNRSGKVPWYLEVFCARQKMENYKDEYHLKKYIADLCMMKDFRLLFHELDRFDNKAWTKGLAGELNKMLEELKQAISQRREKAVIWNFIDNVSYHKLQRDMPWLNTEKDKGLNFSNTFSQMPWTSWTFKALFSGKHVIRDNMFEFSPVGKKKGEYKLYDRLKEEGFDILFLGRKENRQKMKIPFECKCGMDALHEIYCYSTEKQWRALTLLAKGNRKFFLMIHNFCETHTPYITPELQKLEAFSFSDAPVTEKQKQKARVYLDQELQWYADFYGKSICVYMSDHGDKDNVPSSKNNYSDERTHLFYFIIKEGLKRKQYEQFLSVKDEINVLLHVMNNIEINDLLQDGIVIESYDTYSERGVNSVIAKLSDLDKGEWMQFQAYQTNREKYVLFYDGEERYFLMPDEETDHTKEVKYQERIEKLRNQLKPFFVDIDKYEFFRHSRRLYAELEKMKSNEN